jgi:hypothetical protein
MEEKENFFGTVEKPEIVESYIDKEAKFVCSRIENVYGIEISDKVVSVVKEETEKILEKYSGIESYISEATRASLARLLDIDADRIEGIKPEELKEIYNKRVKE